GSPEVQIAIGARAKKAGEGMLGEPIELSVIDTAAQGVGGRMEAYERLLGDATRRSSAAISVPPEQVVDVILEAVAATTVGENTEKGSSSMSDLPLVVFDV